MGKEKEPPQDSPIEDLFDEFTLQDPLEDPMALLQARIDELEEELRLEKAGRQAREGALMLLEKALQTTQSGMVIADDQQRIVYSNPAEARMHGYSPEELNGQIASILAPKHLRKPSEWQRIKRVGSWQRETVNLRRDGTEFPVLLKSDVVLDRNDQLLGVVTTCEDITDRKRAEQELRRSREELRELTGHMEAIQEEERRNIAFRVHDDLGQRLTAISLDLAWLADHVPDEPTLHERVDAMNDLLASLLASVDDITAELRPSVLDKFGVVAAIEWQLEEHRKRTAIGFELEASGTALDEISQEVAISLFRIFQELVTNSIRHAKASLVRVTLVKTPRGVLLEVRDDGIGITKLEANDPCAWGLIGLRERAHRWNGRVTVGAHPKRGTVASVFIPRPKASNATQSHPKPT